MKTIKKWGKRVLVGMGILLFLLVALAVLMPSESAEETARFYATPVPATRVPATMTPIVLPTYTPYPTPEPLPTYTLYPTEVLSTIEPTLVPTISLAKTFGFSEQELTMLKVIKDGISLICATYDLTIDGFRSGNASLQNTSFFSMGLAYGVISIDLENVILDDVRAEILEIYNAMEITIDSGYEVCELGVEITAQGTVVPLSTISDWLNVIETVLCPMLNLEPLIWVK